MGLGTELVNVCVCDAYIMFTVTGRKYGTDGMGEDLQYDTL